MDLTETHPAVDRLSSGHIDRPGSDRTATVEQIFWDDDAPAAPGPSAASPPAAVDVAVIGAGFTGLTCALHLARGGRHIAVLEAGRIGAGASSRNGGMVGPSFHKLGTEGLTARYGATAAEAILREGMLALDHFLDTVRDEGLACDLQMRGRFRGARTVADYDAMAREGERLARAVGLPFDMVPAAEQHREIASDAYRGGVVYHRDGGVNPRKLVVALAQRAAEAGAALHPGCGVTAMTRDGSGHLLHCAGGHRVRAREVVVATNGYADRGTPQMRRRVVPIRVGVIATGDLGTDAIRALSPNLRMHGETGRVFLWSRPSPDGRRFVFGGRFGRAGQGPAARLRALRAEALRVFPQLDPLPVTHVWSGEVAYTVDHAPHLGHHDGVWLAGGYCGSGVTRSVYFGTKLARRILGTGDGATAFDALPFAPVRFRAFGRAGAAALTAWYARKDAADLRRDRRAGSA